MNLTKITFLGAFFISAMAANATSYNCKSAEGNPPQAEATLTTNWWGNKLYSGTFNYVDTAGVKHDNKFTCSPATDKGITECTPDNPDANIVAIEAHPIMGFMIQFQGVRTVTLFDCKQK